eukprot:scaffold50558_cov30-Tisochrysis_lutea.AAC.17
MQGAFRVLGTPPPAAGQWMARGLMARCRSTSVAIMQSCKETLPRCPSLTIGYVERGPAPAQRRTAIVEHRKSTARPSSRAR